MRKIQLAILLAVMALILAACGGEEGNGSGDGENKVYKVGIDTTYPPFEFEENGEYKGIDIDLINAIAENQDFEIKLSPMDFGGIIPSMQSVN